MAEPERPDADASPTASAERERLLDLVGTAIERLHDSGESAMRAFCAGLPEFGEQVLRRIEALRAVGLIDGPKAELPDRLGDFELLERLGVGGMGVVHRARQLSIEREVALKLVRPDQLYFPGVRERFRREIAVVARLRHEGIVQLHSFGEDRGIPWFAMERIVGASLADLLQAFAERTPRELGGDDLFAFVAAAAGGVPADAPRPELFDGTWHEVLTLIAARMARAMAHAHAQGVLHRDLKPSNVMITPEGRVVLLDFGLALTRGVDRMTRTGAQLGSVHYMAPEQVRGDAIDERSDVYAIGVVLYEMLALHPAFDGDFVDEVVRRILAADPQSLTTRNPAITWDLETVCLTAMDPERERRYPSAIALQRDLQNVLEHRTIEARRPGVGIRVRRWAQRHRAVSSALAVALVAMVLAPIAIALRERGLRIELEQAVLERDVQMERASNNVDLAAESLNRVLRRITADRLTDIVDLRDYCEATLTDTSALLDALVDSNPADPFARTRLAETLSDAADLRRGFVDLERARKLFERVLVLLEGVPDDGKHRVLACRVDAWNGIAGIAAQQQRRNDAEQAYGELLRTVGDRSQIGELPVDVLAGIAQALRRRIDYDREMADSGRKSLEESCALRESIAARAPSCDAFAQLAESRLWLAGVLRRTGDREGAATLEPAIDAALIEATKHAAQTIDEDVGLVGILIAQARRHFSAGAHDRAAEFLDLAARRLEPLLEQRGSRAKLHEDEWDIWSTRAALFAVRGDRAAAIEARRASIASVERAVDTWPDMFAARRAQVAELRMLCRQLAEEPSALDEFRARCVELGTKSERFVADFADFATVHLDGAQVCVDLAMVASRTGDLDRADALLLRAREHHSRAEQLAQKQQVGTGNRVYIRIVEIEVMLRRGQDEAALAALRELGSRLPRDALNRAPSLATKLDAPGFAEALAPLRAKR